MEKFIPIRDRLGNVAVWLYGNRFVSPHGHALGFIRGSEIYDYNGSHKGRFVRGVIRDHFGSIVGHVDKAPGLVLLPRLPKLPPFPPLPYLEPLRPLPELPPLPAMPVMYWSDIEPQDFFDL